MILADLDGISSMLFQPFSEKLKAMNFIERSARNKYSKMILEVHLFTGPTELGHNK
jgi:hypothetical protein